MLFSKFIKLEKPQQKILLTLFIFFVFRVGNSIPLAGIDQNALRRDFSDFGNKSALIQTLYMFTGGVGGNLTPFSLGIVPFINSSIIIDLLATLVPFLEELQSDESGREKLSFYKKLLSIIFSLFQGILLVFSLKSYFFYSTQFSFILLLLQLTTGTLITIWISRLIDSKGLGNGTSLIIFANIVNSLFNKNLFEKVTFFDISFSFLLLWLISISQTSRKSIPIVSARQLSFLESNQKSSLRNIYAKDFSLKKSNLLIRFNQAGIFPIIIASNILPFFSYLFNNIIKFENTQLLNTLIYYFLILIFNYFYTTVFWDPEKISDQLRKSSVSIVDVSPGKETTNYLRKIVKETSLLGGLSLCGILYLYDFVKQVTNSSLLNQLNISSLIILVGVTYDFQRTLRSLYLNNL